MKMIFGGMIVVGTTVAIVVPSAMLATYVVQHLWAWHMVQFGLPALNFWQAMGVDVTLTFICSPGLPMMHPDVKTEEKVKHFLNIMLFRPLFALFAGWVAFKMSGT